MPGAYLVFCSKRVAPQSLECDVRQQMFPRERRWTYRGRRRKEIHTVSSLTFALRLGLKCLLPQLSGYLNTPPPQSGPRCTQTHGAHLPGVARALSVSHPAVLEGAHAAVVTHQDDDDENTWIRVVSDGAGGVGKRLPCVNACALLSASTRMGGRRLGHDGRQRISLGAQGERTNLGSAGKYSR